MSYEIATPYRRTINRSVVDSATVTGTVAETIVDTVLIPKNTFTVGDIIEINYRAVKGGTNAAATSKIYSNTTPVVAGANQLASFVPSATSLLSQGHRYGVVKTATNTEFIQNGSTTNPDWNNVAVVGVQTPNIDWTVDQYIIFTITLTNAGTTMKKSFHSIEV